MSDELGALMVRLYFDERDAKTLILGIGYPPGRIPAFHTAATFWPVVILHIRNGAVEDGVRRLLEAAAVEHPGDLEVKRQLKAARGEAEPAGELSVLCLLSDPSGRLQLDEEANQLQELAGDRLRVSIRHAARVSQIIQSIRDEKPHIIHFGGHGSPDGNLLFNDDSQAPASVGLEALARAIAAVLNAPLECVVLNSCYSARGAEAFRGVAKAALGSVVAIPDHCALAFAKEFYAELAAGGGTRQAFEAGRAQAGLLNCGTWGFRYEPLTGPSDSSPR